jgi:tetratricopeptide (TPR) repeat protein
MVRMRVRAVAVLLLVAAASACAGPANQSVTPAPIAPASTTTVEVPPPSPGGASAQIATSPSAPNSDSAAPPDLPPRTDFTSPRDERRGRLQPRARALLVTELNALENLFANVAHNAPDRPTLLRRLAEDYAELEAACVRDGRDQEAAAARTKAIADYALIRSDHPSYPRMDEVNYYMAYEYEMAHDLASARRSYFELIQKEPNSRYIPNAYLAFGEMFFDEAAKDPSKWDLAVAAYQEVIKFPPPDNKVYGYAWYKLGWTYASKGENDKSLNAFKKTIDYGTQYSQLPGAAKLADVTRKDIIFPFTKSGNPSAAYNFFHAISGDVGGSNEHTFKMMDDLGQSYIDTGHNPEAVVIYKDLSVRDPSHNCKWSAQIQVAASGRGQTGGATPSTPCP